jgi:hypothetical protein
MIELPSHMLVQLLPHVVPSEDISRRCRVAEQHIVRHGLQLGAEPVITGAPNPIFGRYRSS